MSEQLTEPFTTPSGAIVRVRMPVPQSIDLHELTFPSTGSEVAVHVMSEGAAAIQSLEDVHSNYDLQAAETQQAFAREAFLLAAEAKRIAAERTAREEKARTLATQAEIFQTRVDEATVAEQVARDERTESETNLKAKQDQRDSIFHTVERAVSEGRSYDVKNPQDIESVVGHVREWAAKVLDIATSVNDGGSEKLKQLFTELLELQTVFNRKDSVHQTKVAELERAKADLDDVTVRIRALETEMKQAQKAESKRERNVTRGGKHSRREVEPVKMKGVRGFLARLVDSLADTTNESTQTTVVSMRAEA